MHCECLVNGEQDAVVDMDGLPVEINESREVVRNSNTLLMSESLRASASPSAAAGATPAPLEPAVDSNARLEQVAAAAAYDGPSSASLLPSGTHTRNNRGNYLIHGGIYQSATRLKQLLDEKELLPNTFAKYPVRGIRIRYDTIEKYLYL